LFATLLSAPLAGVCAGVPARPEPHYLAGKPDQEEGRRALEEFHRLGIAGTYWLEFDLRVMPRHGGERVLHGHLLGRQQAAGPVSFLSVANQRWLIVSGPQPETWTISEHDPRLRQLIGAETLRAIAGTDLTPFDLQMPFLYWKDFAYEGIAKIRGRPAHSFILYPPAEFAAANPGLAAVRVALDSQFHALVQAALLEAKGETQKSITVLDLKKVGEQWLVKEIDVRNHVTRDKTRFTVTAAALNLDSATVQFEPEALRSEPRLPAAAKIERF
jgi:hypothetical protein